MPKIPLYCTEYNRPTTPTGFQSSQKIREDGETMARSIQNCEEEVRKTKAEKGSIELSLLFVNLGVQCYILSVDNSMSTQHIWWQCIHLPWRMYTCSDSALLAIRLYYPNNQKEIYVANRWVHDSLSTGDCWTNPRTLRSYQHVCHKSAWEDKSISTLSTHCKQVQLPTSLLRLFDCPSKNCGLWSSRRESTWSSWTLTTPLWLVNSKQWWLYNPPPAGDFGGCLGTGEDTTDEQD